MKNSYKTKDIYIITNDINNKVYIGQSVNPAHRWEQYKSTVKKKPDTQVITRAMAKYGIEHFSMSILETKVVNYDEREKYWIKFYNSLVPNGYNVAIGGDGTGAGINNPVAKIKSEDVLFELIDELIQNEIPISVLSEKYNISTTQLYAINYGQAYYNEGLNYPLRPSTRYSKEKVDQLTYSLKYELEKTFKQLAKEYDMDITCIHDINQGRAWKRDYLTYPIRLGKMKRAEEIHPQIRDLLLNTKIPQKEIAKQFNISQQTVSEINMGKKGYVQNLEYPLRKNNGIEQKMTCISPGFADEICSDILNTSLSFQQISKKYEVPYSLVLNLNSGKAKKYRNEQKYKYPLRNK